jgi:hypothetical protein
MGHWRLDVIAMGLHLRIVVAILPDIKGAQWEIYAR